MKLGILGAGMIVGTFLEMVGEIPEIQLKAILGTERSFDKLVSIQKEYHIEAHFTDFDKLLHEADIDTVYVALPNHLHYEYAKKALEANKHVICEKPFTLKLAEFMELKTLALSKNLVLVEAITNQYFANYQEIKDNLQALGELKIIECNYSQYSSRYDSFKAGNVLPAFNPKMGGGALMDINIYNIHFVVGLLGKPQSVQYLANMERGIDTSGMLLMDYDTTKVVCIGAKDSSSAVRSTIQGNQGSMTVTGPTSLLTEVELALNEGSKKPLNGSNQHRMYPEFKEFSRMIETNDMAAVTDQLNHSQLVMEVVEEALASAAIVLG